MVSNVSRRIRYITYGVASVVNNSKEASNLASGSRLDESDSTGTKSRSVGSNTAEDIAALGLELLHASLSGLGGGVDGTRRDIVAGNGGGSDGGGSGQDGGDDGELHFEGWWWF